MPDASTFGVEELAGSDICTGLMDLDILIEAALKGVAEVTDHLADRHAIFMNRDIFCLHAVKHRQPCCSHGPHKKFN